MQILLSEICSYIPDNILQLPVPNYFNPRRRWAGRITGPYKIYCSTAPAGFLLFFFIKAQNPLLRFVVDLLYKYLLLLIRNNK